MEAPTVSAKPRQPDVIDLALARTQRAQNARLPKGAIPGGGAADSPAGPVAADVTDAPPPTGERGFASEIAYYSIRGELFDYRRPSVREIEGMLDHDPYAHALEKAITLPLRGAPLSIEPHPNDSGEAAFVKHVLTGAPEDGGMTTPLGTLVEQMCAAIFRKRAYFEKVWQVIEDGPYQGFHGYRKLAYRPASTCTVNIDDNGSFNGFTQTGFRDNKRHLKEHFLPKKCFVYIHDQATRPLEGRGAGDAAFTQYIDKLKVKRLWFAFLQDHALGTLLGTYTGGDRNGEDALLAKMRTARGGGAIVKGIDEDISRLESQRHGSQFIEALHFLNGEMGVSCLAMFLGLGKQGDRGSWALSVDQSDFFVQSLVSELRDFAQSLTDYVIHDLVYFNFGKNAAYPKAVFGALSDAAKAKALDIWKEIVVTPQHAVKPAVLEAIENMALAALEIDPDDIQPPGEPPGETPAGQDGEQGGEAADDAGVDAPGEEAPAPAASSPAQFQSSVAALQTLLRAESSQGSAQEGG